MIPDLQATGQIVLRIDGISLRLKLVALADSGLAAAFYLFFMFTKHNLQLRTIIPFGDDPYDAVGSFSMIFSIILAGLGLLRAFRPYGKRRPSALTRRFLARTEAAVPVGILMTLLVDAMAMARHLSQWAGKSGTVELVALWVGMAAISFLVLFMVPKSAEENRSTNVAHRARRAFLLVLTSMLVLALFPESLIQSISFHLLTIAFSFVLIAALQQAGVVALIPLPASADEKDLASESLSPRAWMPWIGAACAGAAIGAFAFAAEVLNEDAGKLPSIRMLLVSSIFVGSGMAAMLVGFGFFKKPLGLFRDDSIPIPVDDRSTSKEQTD